MCLISILSGYKKSIYIYLHKNLFKTYLNPIVLQGTAMWVSKVLWVVTTVGGGPSQKSPPSSLYDTLIWVTSLV